MLHLHHLSTGKGKLEAYFFPPVDVPPYNLDLDGTTRVTTRCACLTLLFNFSFSLLFLLLILLLCNFFLEEYRWNQKDRLRK